MKKPLIFLVVLISLWLKSDILNAQTGTIVGGELIFTQITDSTYQFFTKLYSSCGSTTPDSFDICFNNPCNSTSFTRKMHRYQTCTNLPTGCASIKSTCDSAASSIPGYTQCWYSAIVTMPSRCSNWMGYVSLESRTGADNLSNSANNKPFYTQVTFNNALTHDNSSPFYSLAPVMYFPINQPYVHNNGARDADGDSLVTTLILPRTANITGCNATPSNIAFASNSYNLTNNPIPTGNTFSLNSQNGLMTFTTTQTGTYSLTFETTEYRNGVKMGSIIREIPVHIYSTNIAPPVTYNYAINNFSSGYFKGTDTIVTCVNQALNFDFHIKSSDPAALLNVQGVGTIPQSALTLQNQMTDSVAGNFNWTPTNTTLQLLTINVVDSICRIPLSLRYFSKTYTIVPTIPDSPVITITISPDSNVTPNTSVTFTVTDSLCNFPTYQWKRNGLWVLGANGKTYTSSSLSDGDMISCRVLCNGACPPTGNDSISNTITMHISSGIDEIENNKIGLYPNPNKGTFTLTLPSDEKNIEVEIINMVGQTVFKHNYDNVFSKKLNIKTENILSGQYIVKVKTAKNQYTAPFIVSE